MGRFAFWDDSSAKLVAAAISACLLYWGAVSHLSFSVREKADTTVLVKLPLFVEVMLAGGDRYLAANIGTVRAMVASVGDDADDMVALGVIAKMQKDVSRLNAGHEDNYYVASATLIGSPLHQAGQWILRRAIDARPYDFLPPFFYAVNRMHYDRDPVDGALWLRVAATRSSDEHNRTVLEKTAARWVLKGGDPGIAVSMLETMSRQARNGSLREYLTKRAQQARDLQTLQIAVKRFIETRRARPEKLQDLVSSGVLPRLPRDPFGHGYGMDGSGAPTVQFAAGGAE